VPPNRIRRLGRRVQRIRTGGNYRRTRRRSPGCHQYL